jgi:hypothetical protein
VEQQDGKGGRGRKRLQLHLHKWTLCAVPLEGIEEAAARETPHLDLVVVGGRHQTLAVAREANAAHGRRVRSEHLGLPFARRRDACTHRSPEALHISQHG